MKRSGWWVLVVVVIVAVALLEHFRVPTGSPVAVPGLPAADPASQGITTVTLDSLGIDGAGKDTTSIVGNGGSVVLSAGYSVHSLVDAPRISVRLERRVGSGGWSPTGRVASARSGQALEVATPAFSTERASEAVQYRLASDTSRSPVVRVVYENPRFYRGVAARIFRYAAPYCPHTAVHVERLTGSEAGLFRTGALLIRVDLTVSRSTVMSRVDQRALALHECSHERQWLNYGSTSAGRTRMEAAARRHFTIGIGDGSPVEHAADCGAKAVNPEGYLGYGGHCTTSELAEGKRLLAGQRY